MPEQFSHYQIIEPIGAGGMGEVFRARDTQLDRDVALKVLPEAFAADPERLARFEREAKLLASLNHPNIGAIYAIARDADRVALALELVEGEDLAERFARGAIPVDEALIVAGQIATALEYAHEQGIVHRDLKPANVKLTPDGTVKVLDFGLAKALDTADAGASDPAISQSPTMLGATTQGGVILGTAAYMSPEQARGKPLDRRTDIFAFGAVLYEMLTGTRAFTGETVSDTLASILKEDPDRGILPNDTPPAVRLLLNRCLEKEPKKRLRDIGEARLIIDAIQEGDPLASGVLGGLSARDEALAAPAAPARRKGGLRAREIAAWTLVVVLAALAGVMSSRVEEPGQNTDASKRILSLPIDTEADIRYTHRGLLVSPDGSRIAYISHRKLYVRRLDSWEPIEVADTEGCAALCWSPDSKWLKYHVGKNIWKVRSDATQRTLVCTLEDDITRVSGGAWLADDRIVFRGEKDLMVVAAAGGTATSFVAADSVIVDFHDPIALPGGTGLVTAVHDSTGINSLAYVSPDGTLKNLVTIDGANFDHPCVSPAGYLLAISKNDLWAIRYDLAKHEVVGEGFSVARGAAVPSVANSGTLVYLHGVGQILRQFVLLDRTGEPVGKLGQPMNLWAAYALSPDASRAVGAPSGDQTDLWIHDDRLAVTRLSASNIEHDMPSFSPDGKMVYSSIGSEKDYRIARQSIDGNQPEEVVVPPGKTGPHYFASCPVTADNKLLFYTSVGDNEKQDISYTDLTSSSEPKRFLAGASREYAARPCPADPTYVAYVSDESGKAQVYLTTWPAADRKVPVSIDGGTWPRWKFDGTELFFAYRNDIYAVDVAYDPLRLGRPYKLFSRPDEDDRQPFGWPAVFDVSADGERFLTTELVRGKNAKSHIAVVQNWDASLTD